MSMAQLGMRMLYPGSSNPMPYGMGGGLVAVSGLDSAACVRQASLVDRRGMGVHPWVS
jgi:hypothetical protein